LEDVAQAISETGQNVLSQSELAEALAAGESGMPAEEYNPGESGGSPTDMDGAGALGEGEAGEYGFGSAESALAIGAAGGPMSEDGAGGAGAGQGSGSDVEQYVPSTNPAAARQEVPIEQAPGPTAPRLGNMQPGAPDVITTGTGTTGPGNVPQSNTPIRTGLDPNLVPRGLRSVVEGYFGKR
jgi:hypothetical protein